MLTNADTATQMHSLVGGWRRGVRRYSVVTSANRPSKQQWGVLMIASFSGLLIASILLAQQPQSKFVWKKTSSRGLLESCSVDLNENGTGQFSFKKRNDEEVRVPVTLKPAAIEALVALFIKSDFLNESKEFASPRKVADMGTKFVRFQNGSQSREVSFNYTEDRGMQEISNFFENLCQQEKSLFEMDLALKYDRLGIPKKLDELDRNLSAKRIVAPERFAPVLERICQDQSLMNLARKEAKKLLSRIEKMQTFEN